MPSEPVRGSWHAGPSPWGEATLPAPSPPASDAAGTALAPPFRPLLGPVLPEAGQQVGDFHLLRVLGEGSFGRVFLAQQLSLDRQVALKVTLNRGSEARTLASLEHDHIVRVFSESVDGQRQLRLLCMQYVAGTTLERVIAALARRDRPAWSGQAVLDVLDQLSGPPSAFHPSVLRDRALLAEADWVQAVCWVGARLAEALDYAHGQGVLHRDVKPANILLGWYGRPLLADFNLSSDARAKAGDFGGTPAYMAPEHLAALDPESPAAREVVDRRSDLYSLGVVLFELLTGRHPFGEPGEEGSSDGVPSARREWPAVPGGLDQILRRCLDPDPSRRYQTAASLAQALEGCREQRRIERELPPPGPLTFAALRRPFLLLVLLGVLPHVLGSLVNISYNAVQIVGGLTARQQATFASLVVAYNLVAYPLCLGVLYRLVVPCFRAWRGLARSLPVEAARLNAARRQMLALPVRAVFLSCLGWLPGGVLFPLGIHLWAGPLGVEEFAHFMISFTVSGLIALTYSFFGVQFVVLRVLYPRLGAEAPDRRQTAREELAAVRPRLRLLQFLAGVIPLCAAVLLVEVGSGDPGLRTFRLLITALIALSMAGFVLAITVSNLLFQTLAVLTASEGAPRGGGRP